MNCHFNCQKNSRRYKRNRIVWLAFLGVIVSTIAAFAEQPNLRIELYPIQTETLTETQFLTGEKKGIPCTIAGELRMPFAKKDRMPAVLLVDPVSG